MIKVHLLTPLLSLGMLALVVGCKRDPNSPARQANSSPPTTMAVDPDEPNAEDLAIEAKLQAHFPDLRYNKIALSAALDDIQAKSGLNVVVDWPALERADIHRDSPVTAKLHDIKISKALELVFKSVEGEEDADKLVTWISKGALVISTGRELDKQAMTRSYDVSDFFPGFVDHAARLADLERFITDNVSTTSWKDNGGNIGTITEGRGNTILICQTPDNHKRIKSVLASLRESQSPK